MGSRNTPFVTLVALLFGACGPSASDIKMSKSVRYDTEFARVWTAVSDEVHKKYPATEVEDPQAAIIRTSWRLVEVRTAEISEQGASFTEQPRDPTNNMSQTQGRNGQQSVDPTGNPTSGAAASVNRSMPQVPGGLFIHMQVKIQGPPWRVSVDGEAAEYKPGLTLLTPFTHGTADEPIWVQSRIDALSTAIYERLKRYAVVDKAPEGPKKIELDTTAWQNLNDKSAVELIAKVRAAAKNKDAHALRDLMDGAFTWASGGEPSADTAVTMFSADPTKLAALTRTLDGGCGTAEDAITCPAGIAADASGSGARAVFRKVGGAWKFVVFLTD
jgi:hypothetical protein